MIAETFFQLLRDPAHWGMELVVELVTGVFIGAWVWPWAQRRWHRRHDAKVHTAPEVKAIRGQISELQLAAFDNLMAITDAHERHLAALESKIDSLRKQWYRAQVDHSRRHEYERPQPGAPRRW